MSVSADTIRKLAALNLPPDKFVAVLDIVAEAFEDDPAKVVRRDRNRRYYEKRLNKTSNKTSETVLNRLNSDGPRAHTCERVLCGEEVILKELPTVVRKDPEPEAKSESQEPKSEDLFANSNAVTDLRQAKRAADKRTIVFVGEGWNALAEQFPRIARISVVPAGGSRERQILGRTKDLLKEFDFTDAESGWAAFFAKIRGSPFLRGDAKPGAGRDRSFKPTLDALTAPQMFVKIMEDHYVDEVQIKRPSAYASAYR